LFVVVCSQVVPKRGLQRGTADMQALAMWDTLCISGIESCFLSITMPAGGCKLYELFTTACFAESLAVQRREMRKAISDRVRL
jgi:hypothetical protein